MVKAEWGIDYDSREDKCYKAPQHEECGAPIMLYEGKYVCIGCGEEAELSADMKKWIDDRSGEKVEIEECITCGKKTMRSFYHKNDITLEWQLGHAECQECGCKLIV